MMRASADPLRKTKAKAVTVTAVPIRTAVRVNAYAVVDRAVDEGVDYGWQRAHKHTDKPNENDLRCAIADAVMGALGEVLIWEQEGE